MTIKNLLNAIQDALQAAATTHLSTATIYRGDRRAWRDDKAVFLIWPGFDERADAIGGGESFSDMHTVWIDVRVPEQSPDGSVSNPSDQYDDFLELCDEVKGVIVTKTNRRISAGSQIANKMEISNVEVNLVDWNEWAGYVCRFICIWSVPQA